MQGDVKRVADQGSRVIAGDFHVVVGGVQLADEHSAAIKPTLIKSLVNEGALLMASMAGNVAVEIVRDDKR